MPFGAEAQKFSATKVLSFQLRVDCDGAQACVEDGDTVETVIAVGSAESARNASKLQSAVRVVTQVQSLLSCRHAEVQIEPDKESVPVSSAIRVRLWAYDVDIMPMRYTRADLLLVFGNQTIRFQWSRGSNEYIADVPAELTSQPGSYQVLVSADNAWNEAAGQGSSCTLLRRTITVEEGFSSYSILGGAGGAAVVVVGALVVVVRKRHAHLQAIMVMLFTEVSSLSLVRG
jgi:hypothetical protein